MAETVCKLNSEFDAELHRIAVEGLAILCYSCSICVGDCPAARFSVDFNPRQIFLNVALGLGKELLSSTSSIWKCTTCYTCYERCPAGVKPVEVVIALRNLAFARGKSPDLVTSIRSSILSTGIAGTVSQRSNQLRERLGLSSVKPPAKEEMEILTGGN